MSEHASAKKPVNERPGYVWVLFFLFVVLPSILWAIFVTNELFPAPADQAPLTTAWVIRGIVIALLPLAVSIYAGCSAAWRK